MHATSPCSLTNDVVSAWTGELVEFAKNGKESLKSRKKEHKLLIIYTLDTLLTWESGGSEVGTKGTTLDRLNNRRGARLTKELVLGVGTGSEDADVALLGNEGSSVSPTLRFTMVESVDDTACTTTPMPT